MRDVSPPSFHTSHLDSNLPLAFHTGIATPWAMFVTMRVLPPLAVHVMASVPPALVTTVTPCAARTPNADGVTAVGPSMTVQR